MASAFADIIYHNGSFTTLDPGRPHASAVAVQDGKFLAVGSDAEMQLFRGPDTQQVDLRGRTSFRA